MEGMANAQPSRPVTQEMVNAFFGPRRQTEQQAPSANPVVPGPVAGTTSTGTTLSREELERMVMSQKNLLEQHEIKHQQRLWEQAKSESAVKDNKIAMLLKGLYAGSSPEELAKVVQAQQLVDPETTQAQLVADLIAARENPGSGSSSGASSSGTVTIPTEVLQALMSTNGTGGKHDRNLPTTGKNASWPPRPTRNGNKYYVPKESEHAKIPCRIYCGWSCMQEHFPEGETWDSMRGRLYSTSSMEEAAGEVFRMNNGKWTGSFEK